ncbi:hypothetical protein AVEN_107784-1 [Araneus ventricosus]|uniref:Uncharacterized protein n=1 Tax=Araneus ventricosus TaxID=182803 RepID=A0A4Y2JIW8_ARAVE|nr:hypothetical protein AVEN_107784-1 [Araneus ventricosus]
MKERKLEIQFAFGRLDSRPLREGGGMNASLSAEWEGAQKKTLGMMPCSLGIPPGDMPDDRERCGHLNRPSHCRHQSLRLKFGLEGCLSAAPRE